MPSSFVPFFVLLLFVFETKVACCCDVRVVFAFCFPRAWGVHSISMQGRKTIKVFQKKYMEDGMRLH